MNTFLLKFGSSLKIEQVDFTFPLVKAITCIDFSLFSAVYKHDLEKHIAAVHKNEDTVYECRECDYSTDKLHIMKKVG